MPQSPQHPDPMVYKPLDTLRLWGENYNEGDIGAIAKSIMTFGFRGAIRIWQDMVIAGNHTVMALMSVKAHGPLSPNKIPEDVTYHWPPSGIVAVGDDWYVRFIDCSDLSYVEAKAFAIADNEVARRAVRDELKLAELLSGIYQESTWIGEATGIDTEDLDAMIADLGDAILKTGGDSSGSGEPAGVDELSDAIQDVIERWHIEPGQVWDIPSVKTPGKVHKLLCVKSNEFDWSSYQIDLTFTDPPYGINIVKVKKGNGESTAAIGGAKPVTIGTVRSTGEYPYGGKRKMGSTHGKARSNIVSPTRYIPVAGDDEPFDPEWLLSMGRAQIIFGGNYFASKLPDSRCWIVWDKNNSGSFADAELAWTSFKSSVKLYQHTWNGLVREVPRDIEGERRIHPTQKPVGLFSRIIQDYAEEDDVIFDPYLGSGTTLIACELTGHAGIGAELEPAYVALTLERLSTLGLQPVLRSE